MCLMAYRTGQPKTTAMKKNEKSSKRLGVFIRRSNEKKTKTAIEQKKHFVDFE